MIKDNKPIVHTDHHSNNNNNNNNRSLQENLHSLYQIPLELFLKLLQVAQIILLLGDIKIISSAKNNLLIKCFQADIKPHKDIQVLNAAHGLVTLDNSYHLHNKYNPHKLKGFLPFLHRKRRKNNIRVHLAQTYLKLNMDYLLQCNSALFLLCITQAWYNLKFLRSLTLVPNQLQRKRIQRKETPQQNKTIKKS